MSGIIRKEDGSISVLKLIGLAVVVSIVVSAAASAISKFIEGSCCSSEDEEE